MIDKYLMNTTPLSKLSKTAEVLILKVGYYLLSDISKKHNSYSAIFCEIEFVNFVVLKHWIPIFGNTAKLTKIFLNLVVLFELMC